MTDFEARPLSWAKQLFFEIEAAGIAQSKMNPALKSWAPDVTSSLMKLELERDEFENQHLLLKFDGLLDLQRTLVASLSEQDGQLSGLGPQLASLESSVTAFDIQMTSLDAKVREVDETCAAIMAREINDAEIKQHTEDIQALRTENTELRRDLHEVQMKFIGMEKKVNEALNWKAAVEELKSEFNTSLQKTNATITETQSEVSEINTVMERVKLKAEESEVALVKVEQQKVGKDEIATTMLRLDTVDESMATLTKDVNEANVEVKKMLKSLAGLDEAKGAVKSLAADVRQQQNSLWSRWSKGQEIVNRDLKGKADKGETEIRLDGLQRDIEQLGLRCSEASARVSGVHLKASRGEVQALQEEVARMQEFSAAADAGVLGVRGMNRPGDGSMKPAASPRKRFASTTPATDFGSTGPLRASGFRVGPAMSKSPPMDYDSVRAPSAQSGSRPRTTPAEYRREAEKRGINKLLDFRAPGQPHIDAELLPPDVLVPNAPGSPL